MALRPDTGIIPPPGVWNMPECSEIPPEKPRRPCRHCGERPVFRWRGLCWRCYQDRRIRRRYRSSSSRANRCRPDFQGPAPLPRPTEFLPGSPEKVLILQDRFARGERLFHPADARILDASQPDRDVTIPVPEILRREWPRTERGQLLLWPDGDWLQKKPGKKRARKPQRKPQEQPWLPWDPGEWPKDMAA